MEARELRIGNYVSINNVFFPLTEKRFARVLNKDTQVEPIPITEEWLEKLGFENGSIEINNENHLICETLMDDDDFHWQYNFNNEGLVFIEYIHQLQNLYFALTGEELELK